MNNLLSDLTEFDVNVDFETEGLIKMSIALVFVIVIGAFAWFYFKKHLG